TLLDLGHEARLADARLAGDLDDRPASCDESVERLGERLELALPAHERRLHAFRRNLADSENAESADGFTSTLQLHLTERLELEEFPHLVRGSRTDDKLAQSLQTCRDVDGVAERVVEVMWRRITRRDHDGPGIDGNARTDLDAVRGPEVLVIAAERLLDGQRRPHRPLGVVLVGRRRPEEREHAVPGQLRD